MLTKYLMDKKEEIKEIEVIPRDFKFKISKEYISVIAGPRRAGKSFLIYDLIRNKLKLEDKDYLYINFEDPEVELNPRILKEAVLSHISIYGKKPNYIFLDEIQILPNWDRALASLHEGSRYKVIVTGSNSRVTSKEIATFLRGRSITHLITTLSFGEFLRFRKVKFERLSSYSEARILKLFKEYLRIGGFPQVVLSPEIRRQFFDEYKNVVIYRDIVERYKIRNLKLLRYLLVALESSVGRQFSIYNAYKEIKNEIKVSKKTIYNYYDYILNSFMFFEIKKYYPSIRKRERSIPKVYICDPGFLEDISKSLENAVFLELLREFRDIFYISDQNRELDFYIPNKYAIQVSYELNRSSIKREIRGFENVKGKKILVTLSNTKLKNIKIVNAVDFLL